MRDEKTWRKVVDLAEHYLAIGQTEVYLFDRNGQDRPWEYVTEVKDGNLVRGNIRADLHILAAHPCGVTFQWTVDLFRRDDEHGPAYQVDMDGMLYVLENLPAHVRPQLRRHLRDTAQELDKHATEAMGWADRERHQADALYRLGSSEVGARIAGQIEAAR